MSKQFPFLICLILMSGAFLPLASYCWASERDASQENTGSLADEIRQLAKVRDAALSERSGAETQSAVELDQYLQYLDSRIEALCARLYMREGRAAISGLPCPSPSVFIPGYQTPSAATSEQEVESLDRQLVDSLGQFDEFLAEEQKKLASRRHREYATGAGSQAETYASGTGSSGAARGAMRGDEGEECTGGDESGGGGASGKGEGSASSGEMGAQPASNGTSQPRKGSKAAKEGPGSQSGGPAYGTGSSGRGKSGGGTGSSIYQDDDIVARQLREAAEKETDPELKKKLWEEYRRYKEGNR